MLQTPLRLLGLVSLALLIAGLVLALPPSAHALPPAGTETLTATGSVSITGRTGNETIAITGTVTIQRATPHMKGSVQASNAEITAMSLAGTSVTGPVTMSESPSQTSNGELRAIMGNDLPATSFFNVYAVVTIPASPNPSITLHNNVPIVFNNPHISNWPPYNTVYTASPASPILLEPSIQNPAQVKIVSATITVTSPGVGGVSQLAAPIDEDERAEETTGNDHAVGIGVVLALVGAFGVMANYARARLRSEG